MTDLYTLTIGKRPWMWVAVGMLATLFPSQSEAQLVYPQITQITPSSAYANSEFTLRTTGAGFDQPCCSSTPPGPNSAKVFFNGVNGIAVDATYTRSGDTGMLTALIPADALISLSGTTVFVTIDWCHDFCFSNPLPFTIYAAPPPPPPPDCEGNNVDVSIVDQRTGMKAVFSPASGLPLSVVAVNCHFERFNWQQYVTVLPLPNPFHENNAPTTTLSAPPEFLDPPPGGYTYKGFIDNSNPFFYDFYRDLSDHQTGLALTFIDHPTDECLPSESVFNSFNPTRLLDLLSFCNGHEAPSGSYVEFRTALVGVLSGNVASPPLYEWKWRTTFNGTSGQVSRLNNNLPVDPGSGSGGITITEINGVVQLPPSIGCTATPTTLWPPNGQRVVVMVSGRANSGTNQIVSLTYAVTDEYGQFQPSGAISLSADGRYSATVPLVASRNGNDKNGRTYVVSINATDSIGNVRSCATTIKVPHDQSK